MRSITPADFCRAVQHITPASGWPSSRIAVAVSGGPDSIALLRLLAGYVRTPAEHRGARPRPQQLVAVTVDHQLRANSGKEAEAVKRFSLSLGVEHHTLSIPWGRFPFPAFPSPHKTEAPARTARLLLYRELSRREGIASLWTGHHRGDQVETVLMRGKGMLSVARMESEELLDEEGEERWIVRPLLGFDKSQLVEYCKHHALPYFIDPTNLDPLHTPRNALRESLAEVQKRHLSHPHTLPTATAFTSGPLHLLHRILPAPSPPSVPAAPPGGLFTLNFPRPTTLTLRPHHLPSRMPPSSARDLLRRAIAFASPLSNGSISHAALEDARRRIWESAGRVAFTPGSGVWFTPRIHEGKCEWIVGRQPRRRKQGVQEEEERFELLAGEGRVWDGRVWLRVERVGGGGEVVQDERWYVESRGRWSLPVVRRVRARLGEKDGKGEGEQGEVMLDLSEEERSAKGEIAVQGARISWRCRKVLR